MARLSTLARFEVSGEILSEDTIAMLATAECKLPGAEIDAVEFATAWDLLSDEWQRIRQEIGEYDTERLRRRWVMPLLDLLGHNPQFLRSHPTYAEGRTIPLTHRSGDVPMWFLDYAQSSDEKLTSGRRRNSPHELFQEYLDLTDDDWGIICNGRTIRLLHDYHKTLTRNYVEADLESIFEALDIDAFRAVWRIFRSNSFQPQAKGVRPIEKLCEQSRQEGAEIGKELRKQVLEAIRTLGNGFLSADHTGELREALTGEPEAPMLFYQALLRIVYRLLFLLYIENKPGWTPATSPVWASSYSISRLREQAEEATSTRADGEDHWEGLKVIFGIIRDGSEFFNIHPYGGELFDDGKLWRLDQSCLRNSDLLTAIRLLTFFEDKKKKVSYRVNFRTIRINALGSVYEALLDVAPAITPNGVFTFAEGTERKLTGSYYTAPELVAELVKSALVPVIEDRLREVFRSVGLQVDTSEERWLVNVLREFADGTLIKRVQRPAGVSTGDDSGLGMLQSLLESAILAIKVVDPACGSGAFLVQALDKLTEYLCWIRKLGEEPSELDIREARRDVVTHCIHGVDLNPMAVELCKFTLWLHVAHPKLPLSYLEPRIKCGNALIGVPLKKQVEAAKAKIEAEKADAVKRGDRKAASKLVYVGWPDNVPDEAFDPVTGDDKAVAKRIKERNKKEREQAAQTSMDDEWLRIGRLADWFGKVNDMPEDTIEAVRKKSEAYAEFVRGQAYEPARFTADAWCAAFFWPLDEEHEVAPTTKRYRDIEKNPNAADYHIRTEVRHLADLARFFHWELEFPAVFMQGGFDCVLGNPPWEMLQLEEREFFASRAPNIALMPGSERKRAIENLLESNPTLAAEFEGALHTASAHNKYVREAGRFQLTAVGKLNTYALFAETSLNLHGARGRAGVVLPTGIATDDTTKAYFGNLVSTGRLRSLYGYENEGNIFVGVHHAFKFALLTIGNARQYEAARLAFLCRRVEDIHDPLRRFSLTADDFALLNPNTRTCPVFRTRADAELTKAIYRRVPALWDERQGANPWDVRFQQGLFNMTSDSGLFHNAPEADDLPLYEAKMIHQFDHRYATYEGASEANMAEGSLPQPGQELKSDPDFAVLPRYWVNKTEVEDRVSRVPEDLIKAVRARDKRLAAVVIQYWVAGWCLNHGKETEGVSIMNRICTGPFSAWMNSMRAQELEQEMPLSDIDRDRIAVYGLNEEWLKLAGLLIEAHTPKWLLGFRGITSSVVEHTAIFSILPLAGVGNSAPIMCLSPLLSNGHVCCFLANLNSIATNYALRQKIAGPNLNFFIVKQLAVLPPGAYAASYVEFIAPRVLELVYTAWDMKPFAEDMGYDGPPFVWDEDRRALLRAELDAYYARLYGLNRKQLRYILDPHGLSDRELEDILDPWEDPTCSGPHLLPEHPTEDFPGETFRVLKNNEEKKHGEYRTRRLVLEAWARLEAELGPVKVVNYREMLERQATSLAELAARSQPALKVAEEEPEYLVLVPPDYTPQEKLALDEPARIEDI